MLHSQEKSYQFVYKVVPEACLPGLKIPAVEDLLNMELCTLWIRFKAAGGAEEQFDGP